MRLRYLTICLLLLFPLMALRAQDRTDSRFIEAVQAYTAGNAGAAAIRFEALVKAEPGMDAAWYYLGLCRMAQRNAPAAQEAFRKAVELDPSNYWYRERLATTYAISGDTERTISQYEALLAGRDDHLQLPNSTILHPKFSLFYRTPCYW